MKPKRIILIRHGESQGNVDSAIYAKIPDYALMLTDKGMEQAKEVGNKLNSLIGGRTYGVYYSPYFRARQTMDIALRVLDNNLGYNKLRLFKREEPRLREQEYSGKLQEGRHDDDAEREAFGKFFYRMNGGESGADVFDRVSDCIGSLNRDFEKGGYPENIVIFGHGMTNRLFIMRWFHCMVEEFERWKNPPNGHMYILELNKFDRYTLETKIDMHDKGYGWKYEFRH